MRPPGSEFPNWPLPPPNDLAPIELALSHGLCSVPCLWAEGFCAPRLASRTVVDRASPLGCVPSCLHAAMQDTASVTCRGGFVSGVVPFSPLCRLLCVGMSTQVAESPRTWPHVMDCDCGTEVVLGRHERTGAIIVLDATPVVVGVGSCTVCKGKGRRAVPMYAMGGVKGNRATARFGDLEGKIVKGTMTSCPECAGTGVRGEDLERGVHVVMSEDGVVRSFGRGQLRLLATWDSAYRRHACEATP